MALAALPKDKGVVAEVLVNSALRSFTIFQGNGLVEQQGVSPVGHVEVVVCIARDGAPNGKTLKLLMIFFFFFFFLRGGEWGGGGGGQFVKRISNVSIDIAEGHCVHLVIYTLTKKQKTKTDLCLSQCLPLCLFLFLWHSVVRTV